WPRFENTPHCRAIWQVVQSEAQAREGWEGWPDRASPTHPDKRVRGTEPPTSLTRTAERR
ncbi:MAG: hypothetical protein V3V57_01740, partial [Spirochaetia bacterium]